MLNLAFDTTAGSCSVLLTEDGKTLEKYVKNVGEAIGESYEVEWITAE